jgi:hypothetical protein
VTDATEPIGQDCAVKLTRRSLGATGVVILLLAAAGGATWLGVSESPRAQGALARFITDSEAEGTLAFVMTSRTAGVGSTELIHGVIDFADDNGSEVSETVVPHALAQYAETVVVHGAAYGRLAADRADGPRFDGPWQRGDAGISVPPFAPRAGPVPPLPVPPHLVRLADARVDGVATTEYQVASFGVSCPPGTGPATQLHEATWLWVDGQGRVRRWENRTEAQTGNGTTGLLTTTVMVSFGDFGAPVSVSTPTNVLGAPTPTSTPINPLAGCLVTPG